MVGLPQTNIHWLETGKEGQQVPPCIRTRAGEQAVNVDRVARGNSILQLPVMIVVKTTSRKREKIQYEWPILALGA
jgi:hypothetical protein